MAPVTMGESERFRIQEKLLVGFEGTAASDPWASNLQRKLERGLGRAQLFRLNLPAAIPQRFLRSTRKGSKVQRIGASNGYLDSPSLQQISSLHLEVAALAIDEVELLPFGATLFGNSLR